MPGYGEQMRAISLRCAAYFFHLTWAGAVSHAAAWQGCRYVPTAVLSRQTAGLRGKCLILNLPGKPKAIRETIDEVLHAFVTAASDQLSGIDLEGTLAQVFQSIPYCIDLIGGPMVQTNPSVVKAFRPGSKP